jgi:hypothetical protein
VELDLERPAGRGRVLLAFAPVAFELMTGIFEFARFVRIEFGLGSANLTNEDVEVGRMFKVPDESGKREFLYRHRVPPCGKHSKYPGPRPDYYGVLTRPSKLPCLAVARGATLRRKTLRRNAVRGRQIDKAGRPKHRADLPQFLSPL